jgi:type III restriction enzyme
LSSVGIKGEELRRFVHLPIQPQLDAVRSKLSSVASQTRSVHDALREHKRLAKENAAARTELQSIEQQLIALRESLKGMSDEDKKLIAEQPGWIEEERLVAQWRKEGADVLRETRSLRARLQALPSALGNAHVHDRKRMRVIGDLLRAMFDQAAAGLGEADTALSGETATRSDLQKTIADWEAAARENREKYEAAKLRAAASETTLKQITDLERRQREILAGIAQRDERFAALGDPEGQFVAIQAQWRALHTERTAHLEAQCESLGKLSKGLLRATVRRGAGTERVTATLKDLVRGTKMRTEKLEQLLETVAADPDPPAAWTQIVAEFRALSELDSPGTGTGPLPATPRLTSAGIADSDRRKLAERLAASGWGELAVLELEDVPQFEYRAREGDYISFGDASAGQQATALMLVLLNQEGPPLVIDQPEDDLDNHIIGDVVQEVWLAKTRRQLIFASHNANLVVNGDAELIVCCDYRTTGDQSGGTIKLQGAIDIEEVRNEIASVMEGGREAFTLRREKYGF